MMIQTEDLSGKGHIHLSAIKSFGPGVVTGLQRSTVKALRIPCLHDSVSHKMVRLTAPNNYFSSYLSPFHSNYLPFFHLDSVHELLSKKDIL